MGFPINTQEEFDEMIKDRLDRNTNTVTAEVSKKFEGYLSPDEVQTLQSQITTLTEQIENGKTQIATLTEQNKNYENNSVKMRVANEVGLPFELANKLSGQTEEDIRNDALAMAKFVQKTGATPMFSSEQSESDKNEQALRDMLKKLKE